MLVAKGICLHKSCRNADTPGCRVIDRKLKYHCLREIGIPAWKACGGYRTEADYKKKTRKHAAKQQIKRKKLREQGHSLASIRFATLEAHVAHTERNKAWARANKKTLRDYSKKIYRLLVSKYGGDPSKNWAARVKWMAAREMKREAHGNKG